MKKIFYFTTIIILGLALSSCTCECVGPNDQNPANKLCKTEYENINGQGTWSNYETSAKQAGQICK